MFATLGRAVWLLRSRPAQFAATLRQYLLFARTHFFRRLAFGTGSGILLSENVRVQRLSCLSAERPNALIQVGRDSIVYEHARIEAYGQGRITIGQGSIIGDARIYSRTNITLGKRVVTSWNVFVQDFDPHPIDPSLRRIQMERMTSAFRPTYGGGSSPPTQDLPWDFPADPVSIGDDVWLGANVTILKGARIGDGCVVAAGAVVTAGDWPARSILAGTPAKVIKSI